MIDEEEFISWLNDDDRKEPFVTNERNYQEFFLKVPRSKQFVYLYSQSCFNGKGIERNTSFSYAGFYNKANEMIYEFNYRFANPGSKHICNQAVSEIFEDFEENVRNFIRKIIDSNRDYYEGIELSAEGKEKLQDYEDKRLAQSARKAYLEGISGEDISYDLRYCYRYSKRSDDALLGIIAEPEKYIQSEAEKFIRESEDDIVYELKTASLKKEVVKVLESEEDGLIQRIKRIMDAIEKSGAQSVKVTIKKDGEEFTFRTSSSELTRDPFHYYSSYNIVAADRKIFEQKFGRYTHYTPEEIVDISYRGKSIYSAEPFEFGQDETSGMAIKM